MKPIYDITEYSPEIKPLMRVVNIPVQKFQYIGVKWIFGYHRDTTYAGQKGKAHQLQTGLQIPIMKDITIH